MTKVVRLPPLLNEMGVSTDECKRWYDTIRELDRMHERQELLERRLKSTMKGAGVSIEIKCTKCGTVLDPWKPDDHKCEVNDETPGNDNA